MTAPVATPTRGRRAAAPAPNPTTAIVPSTLTNEDLIALLGQAGVISQGGGEYHRLTLKAGVLETDDGDMFPPLKGKPSLTVRIVKPPVYYNAFFLSDKGENGSINAAEYNRPDMNGRFCRKYDDPAEQAADTNPANTLYDEIAKDTGTRGSFKADIQVQIVPESGTLTGEETVYTLTLSTTSVFEFRGSTRDPGAGSVSAENFLVKLAKFAVAETTEAGADEAGQKTAVLNAMTSLRLGGVVADVYLLRAENDAKSMTWWVVSFDPIHVEPPDGGAPALGAGTAAASDNVPF
jgi:hypothetical protein